ncbi:MAG: hypothetical protein MUE52_15895 [Tabrizicola sp.]|jgi:hypothetical protein|nr:hypothetical protein [Tabrizicola sp.]
MKKILGTALVAAMAVSASTAYAGGPVTIVEEPEVVAEKPASSVGILPLLLVGVVLCVALCGGDDEETGGGQTVDNQ